MKRAVQGMLAIGTTALLLGGCEGVGTAGADYEALQTEVAGLREDYNALSTEFGTFREEWGSFYGDWGTYREEIGLGGGAGEGAD